MGMNSPCLGLGLGLGLGPGSLATAATVSKTMLTQLHRTWAVYNKRFEAAGDTCISTALPRMNYLGQEGRESKVAVDTAQKEITEGKCFSEEKTGNSKKLMKRSTEE